MNERGASKNTKNKESLNAFRSSVKRKDLYEGLTKELDIQVRLPIFACETLWGSTFAMVKNAYRARKVLSAVTHRICDTAVLLISEAEWRTCDTSCAFLEHVAVATEFVSGQTYNTFSAVEGVMSKLRRKCDIVIVDGNPVLSVISEKMRTKLLAYEKRICTRSAVLAPVLNPRFANDILRDGDLLREVAFSTGASRQYLDRASGSAVDDKTFHVHGEEPSEAMGGSAGDGVIGGNDMMAEADEDRYAEGGDDEK